jgi:hypothetical protein
LQASHQSEIAQLKKEHATAMRLQQTRLKAQHQAEVNELQRQAIDEILDTIAARVRPSSELDSCSILIMFLHVFLGIVLSLAQNQVIDSTCLAENVLGYLQCAPDLTNIRSSQRQKKWALCQFDADQVLQVAHICQTGSRATSPSCVRMLGDLFRPLVSSAMQKSGKFA